MNFFLWLKTEEYVMEKVITISNKNFNMKASALTQFSYKNFTGRSFLKDLQDLTKLKNENLSNIDDFDNVTELILKIVYILVKEYDKEHNSNQITDYEDLLGKIDNLYDDGKWLYEVLELACSPISRQLQTIKQ